MIYGKASYYCASHASVLIITNLHVKRHEKHFPRNRVVEVDTALSMS